MRFILFSFCIFLFYLGYCQKQTAFWYFGNHAGLNFNFNPPKPLLDGKIDKEEGNGCLADKNGILLYYTDGDTIWGKNNLPIKNGYGLKGRSSATQGSLILIHPSNKDSFYILTNTDGDVYDSPFLLNIIYKNQIILKNKSLVQYGSEKMNAVNHQNNKDIWISTHSYDNDTFYSILLKKDGIIDCPVIQKIEKFSGKNYNGDNQGQIKFSCNGKYICANNCGLSMKSLIGSFDSENGIISKSFILNHWFPYSSEFSNNSKYLYICDRKSSIYQYNLSNFDSAVIEGSKFEVKKLVYSNIIGMQLALDRKIYVNRPNATSLDVILSPDSSKSKADYRDSYQYLGGQVCAYGLPNFNQSYFFTPSIDYAYEQDCRTNTIVFEGKDTIKSTSYKWVFSKGTKTDTKTTKDVSYTFADTGKWEVKYIASNGNRSDTVAKTITIRPKLEQGFLGEDIKLCKALPLNLYAPKNLHCIHWYNDTLLEIGKTDSINITKPRTYYAKATNQSFCVEWDTIRIDTAVTKPKANFTTTDVCENSTTYFTNLSKNAETYYWKFGDGITSNSENPIHKYSIGGVTKTFNVKLISEFRGGCTDSITKQITINAKPKKGFTYTKSGQLVSFTALETNATSYKWAFGDGGNDTVITNNKTTHSYSKFPSGKYTACLRVTNLAGCVADTCMEIQISGSTPSIAMQNDITIYPNPSKGKFIIHISKAGNYSLQVYNETGQLVLERSINGNQTNLIFLNHPNGNYLIEIKNDEGSRITRKVVIE